MKYRVVTMLLVVAASIGVVGAQGVGAPKPPAEAPKADAGAGPVLVVETEKGTIEIQTFPADAPKTVEHVVALAKRKFYNGLRVHRAIPGFVVQFGDPQTRDITKRDLWGSGGSGRAIGVAEVRRSHVVGAVAMAHAGNPLRADSQMYIVLDAQPQLDRDFTVFGQVRSGMDVAQQLSVNDVIRSIATKP